MFHSLRCPLSLVRIHFLFLFGYDPQAHTHMHTRTHIHHAVSYHIHILVFYSFNSIFRFVVQADLHKENRTIARTLFVVCVFSPYLTCSMSVFIVIWLLLLFVCKGVEYKRNQKILEWKSKTSINRASKKHEEETLEIRRGTDEFPEINVNV